MSFHIDILPLADGGRRQLEYTREGCIERGWLDPCTGRWLRERVLPPSSDDAKAWAAESWPDPRCGKVVDPAYW